MTDTDTTPETGETVETANLPVPVDQAPAAGARGFVRDHPGLVIAGGLVVGALAAALLPRRNRERVSRGASHIAEAAAAAGLAIGRQMLDRAESASGELRRHGSDIAGKVEDIGGAARAQAGRIIAPAEKAATGAAQRIVDLALDIQSRIRK